MGKRERLTRISHTDKRQREKVNTIHSTCLLFPLWLSWLCFLPLQVCINSRLFVRLTPTYGYGELHWTNYRIRPLIPSQSVWLFAFCLPPHTQTLTFCLPRTLTFFFALSPSLDSPQVELEFLSRAGGAAGAETNRCKWMHKANSTHLIIHTCNLYQRPRSAHDTA